MKEVLPDYNDSLTNLACSILKYFEVDYKHNTISDVDRVLEENNPKNVVLILYDGMGYNLVNRILKSDDFLRVNMKRSISSVCPSTTTAATTSILSGLNPSEHNWLGWDMYVKEEDKIITLFLNTYKDTYKQAAPYNIARKYYGYKSLIEQINSGPYTASIVSPHGGINYKNLSDMNDKIVSELSSRGKKYIYVYYKNPDSTMHDYGTDAKETIDVFNEINKSTEELSNRLKDTLLIVVADHGHINSTPITISEYKDFYDTLDGDVSIEARFCSFKVKSGKEKEFEKLFNKYFSKWFILKTKEEIIREFYFGRGDYHKYYRDSLGDYFALAIGDKYFRYNDNSVNLVSMHAGLTEDEMRIPLIMKLIK